MHVLTDSKTLSSKWKATIRAAPRFLRLNADRGDKIQLTKSVENRYYTKKNTNDCQQQRKRAYKSNKRDKKEKAEARKPHIKARKPFNKHVISALKSVFGKDISEDSDEESEDKEQSNDASTKSQINRTNKALQPKRT